MNQDSNTETNLEIALQELRLRPGTEMTVVDSKGKELSHKTQFIAVFVGKSILVSLKVDSTPKIALREGEQYHFGGFTGKYDFSFSASVLQVDKAQFNARLTCPASVSVKLVRNNLRVKLALASQVMQGNIATPIVINDLSASGACLNSQIPLGKVGDRFNLTLPVDFEKKKNILNLTTEIRHITETEQGLHTGVEFIETTQQDKLMMHYFVNTLHDEGPVI